jgi:hypothetical protein
MKEKITEQEFDELLNKCKGVLFGCEDFGGYFAAPDEYCEFPDLILISDETGYYKATEDDLVRSNDGILVCQKEKWDGKDIPNFEDVFEVKEI